MKGTKLTQFKSTDLKRITQVQEYWRTLREVDINTVMMITIPLMMKGECTKQTRVHHTRPVVTFEIIGQIHFDPNP